MPFSIHRVCQSNHNATWNPWRLFRSIWIPAFLAGSTLFASDNELAEWTFWRGPEQNGISREKNLPDSWDLKGKNLVWRNENYGTRCTPVAMNGKLYFVARHKPETQQEGEKIVCLDAATGQMIWEDVHNIFLSDAPAERVGWAPCVADSETGLVYALGIGCKLKCLNGETGEIVWERSMLEEFGMLSTYGGRTNVPQLFENMLIVSGVMTQWGENAQPAHRFLAMDKLTGETLWFNSTVPRPEDTTYSTPVFTTFNGQAAMVVGAADGALYAMQPRTGNTIWRYQASPRGFNTTPLIVDNRVYCAYGEKSFADTTILGGAFALDGLSTGNIAEEDLFWKIDGRIINRSSPIYVNGYVYMVDDAAGIMAIDPETGKIVAQKKAGRIMFGSLLYADGKIYCGESTGNVWIYEPQPDGSLKDLSRVRLNREEIFGSPIAYHGRVYFATTDAMYCIGLPDVQPSSDPIPDSPLKSEKSVNEDTELAHIQVIPVESLLGPEGELNFRVEGFNAKGQSLGIVSAELTLEGEGTLANGKYVAPSQGHHVIRVTATVDNLSSTARARIVPPLPWSFDFEDGKVPPTWIGADYRHQPAEFEGQKCLMKVQTIPKGTRSQLWMGPWDLSDYTVQADLFSTGSGENIANMGLVNQRYTLDVMAKQQLQIRSWTPRLELRFAKTIPFSWEPNQWYTAKFQSENHDEGVTLRGKVWKRDEAEPADWQIEATDRTPNRFGSPGLFGNSFLAPFYIDNVKVSPN